MAFNQASFFLFPPRYGAAVELDHSARTTTGEPLQKISSTIVNPSAPKICSSDLHRWFKERNFAEKESHGRLRRLWYNPVVTALGKQGEIELPLAVEDEEVEELYIRFLLTENTPAALPRWSQLIAELGHDFSFQLMDDDHRLLPCVDFKTLLTTNWNFRFHQENCGWDMDLTE